jgi:protein O-mannosyl-transferase
MDIRTPAMRRLALGALLLLTLAVFSPVFANGFLNYDDAEYIVENPKVHGLAPENIRAIFASPHLGQYAPLTLLSIALEYRFSGPDPAVYHATNLLLHLLNGLLVWLLFKRWTRSEPLAFAVCALFLLHPLHVEPVAAAFARKDVLYAFFFLSSLLQLERYRNGEGKASLPAAAALFVLSLLSKPMAVMLPLAAFLAERFFPAPRRIPRNAWILFAALSAAFVLLTLGFHSSARAGLGIEGGLLGMFLAVCHALLFYVKKIFMPWGLVPLYPWPGKLGGVSPALFVLSPFVLAAAAYLVARLSKKFPPLFFGAAFYALTLLPVLPFFKISYASVADRYAYLPSLGIFYIVAHGIVLRRYALPLALLLCAGLSYAQARTWKDSGTVWTHAIASYPDSAVLYVKRGEHRFDGGDFAGAWQDYDRSIRLRPDIAHGYSSRGAAALKMGRQKEALADFETALGIDPRDPFALKKRQEIIG